MKSPHVFTYYMPKSPQETIFEIKYNEIASLSPAIASHIYFACRNRLTNIFSAEIASRSIYVERNRLTLFFIGNEVCVTPNKRSTVVFDEYICRAQSPHRALLLIFMKFANNVFVCHNLTVGECRDLL